MSHIDVFKAYEDLLAAGVEPEHAKAHVRVLDNALDRVATKDDLKGLEKDINKEIRGLRWFIVGVGTVCALPILQELFKFAR